MTTSLPIIFLANQNEEMIQPRLVHIMGQDTGCCSGVNVFFIGQMNLSEYKNYTVILLNGKGRLKPTAKL